MVVMDSRKRRDGAAIEELGWYNPIDASHSFVLKEDRILNWLKEGAQTTEAADKLLRRAGISHKWHLIKQGLNDSEVQKEMKKWEMNREKVLNDRNEKIKSKIKEQEKKAASHDEEIVEEIIEDSPKTNGDKENDGHEKTDIEIDLTQSEKNEMEEE